MMEQLRKWTLRDEKVDQRLITQDQDISQALLPAGIQLVLNQYLCVGLTDPFLLHIEDMAMLISHLPRLSMQSILVLHMLSRTT